MKTIVLSNYVERELVRLRDARNAEDQARDDQYSELLKSRNDMRAFTRSCFHNACATGRIFSALGHSTSLIFQALRPPPPPPTPQAQSERERRFQAGAEGEKRVLDALDRELDDMWTGFIGYRAWGGDLDVTLIGPTGMYAIEVKSYNAVVRVNGDDWLDTKGRKPRCLVSDTTGLSPSQQLKRNLSSLKNYLYKSHGFKSIQTIVVLAHINSRLVGVSNSTVDLITTLDQWNISEWFSNQPVLPPPFRPDTIARRVVCSHNKWNKADAMVATYRSPAAI